jgi:hypothetical protein
MSKNETQKGCACTQGLQDRLRAANTKRGLLKKSLARVVEKFTGQTLTLTTITVSIAKQ